MKFITRGIFVFILTAILSPLHSRAQETPVLILALLAKDAGAQAEQAGPRQMIERQTANQFFDDLARRILAEDDLFFRADDARHAIDQIHDHRADADQIELFFILRCHDKRTKPSMI